MGVKKRNTYQLHFRSTTPIPYNPNIAFGGSINGAMASTNTIYSSIQDLSNFDNEGLEVSWTGTPTGVISVYGSESGVNFFALTFDPALDQPAGAAGGYLINLNQFPWRYIMIKYVNASGSGTLNVWLGSKDLN